LFYAAERYARFSLGRIRLDPVAGFKWIRSNKVRHIGFYF
jgi:hypothetical protein